MRRRHGTPANADRHLPDRRHGTPANADRHPPDRRHGTPADADRHPPDRRHGTPADADRHPPDRRVPCDPTDPNGQAQRGFSLVELLVVLVILGLLVGIVAPNFMGKAEQSRTDIAKVQIENLHVALQTYRMDIGQYPSTEQGLAALMQPPAEVAEYWHGPYLNKEMPVDPWRNPYQYRYPADNLQGLALYSMGADGAEGGEGAFADIGFLPNEVSD